MKEFLDYCILLDLGRATARTKEGYYYSAAKVCDGIGHIKLNEVSTELMARCLNVLKQEYAQSTLDKIYIVLKMSFKYAAKKNIIAENPMEDISRPKSSVVKGKEFKAYSQEEIDLIMSTAESYPELYPQLIVLKYSGMRPGELRALKWSNVDFGHNTIRITNAATFDFTGQAIGKKSVKKEFIGPTKSEAGKRTLSVPDEVIVALKAWREYIDNNKLYKYARESEFLFTAKTGTFRLENALRLKFNRFLKKEKLDKTFTLYRFRHTVCTNLIKEGVDLPTVQKIMGDSSTDVILKVYTHISSDHQKEASQKLFNSYSA